MKGMNTFKLMAATLPPGLEFLFSITHVMDLKQVSTTCINKQYLDITNKNTTLTIKFIVLLHTGLSRVPHSR